MKRLLMVILAVVMIFSVFACTKKSSKNPGVTTTPAVTTPEATTPEQTTEDPSKPTHLPTITFDGADFVIAAKNWFNDSETLGSETSTNKISQALWQRNAAVQDQYDVKFDTLIHDGAGGVQINALLPLLLADENPYDLGLTYAFDSAPLVTEGLVINWKTLDYTDFSKPYWMNDVNDTLTFDDAIYTPVGDMCSSTIFLTYGMFYNRTVGDSMVQADGTTLTQEIFQKVDDMEWTIDYLIQTSADVYNDIDDVPGLSEDDFFGFMSDTGSNLDNFSFAFNIPITKTDPTEGIKIVLRTEKTSAAVDKLRQLYHESNGTLITPHNPTKFSQGRALFSVIWLNECTTVLANMEDQYTILPSPLFDENQTKYTTGAMDNYSVMSIPKTCRDLELVSIIAEALNYESHVRVKPVYHEEYLQKRYTQDIESIEMVQLLIDGLYFDMSSILMSDIYTCFRSAVAENKDFTTYYDRNVRRYEATIKTIVTKYNENKA